jgi:hypothetical protein
MVYIHNHNNVKTIIKGHKKAGIKPALKLIMS